MGRLCWQDLLQKSSPANQRTQRYRHSNNSNSDFLPLPLNIWLSLSWCSKASLHLPSSQSIFCPFKRPAVAGRKACKCQQIAYGMISAMSSIHPMKLLSTPRYPSKEGNMPMAASNLGTWEIPWAKFCCFRLWVCWYPDPHRASSATEIRAWERCLSPPDTPQHSN